MFGGFGVVFWMWVIVLVGMVIGFVEVILVQLFKICDDKGQFCGGLVYYMEKGLGVCWMGILFLIFLIIVFGFVFNLVQVNIIIGVMQGVFGVLIWISGIVVVIFIVLIIFGGLCFIVCFFELVVFFMVVVYLLLVVGIILFNFSELLGVLVMVVKSVFGWYEVVVGGIGVVIFNGFKCGLFFNEVGMGLVFNVVVLVMFYLLYLVFQGYVQMVGVFIDILLICIVFVVIILLVGLQEGEGIMLVQNVLISQVGDWGCYFLVVIILFFVFILIVVNYFYVENCLVFFEYNYLVGLLIFCLIVLVMVMFGVLVLLLFVWNFVDVLMGLMVIINLIVILLLFNFVIKLVKDYNVQCKVGKLLIFDVSQFLEVQQKFELGIWDDCCV